jgi:Sec-independent protein secretion pathway component TatC
MFVERDHVVISLSRKLKILKPESLNRHTRYFFSTVFIFKAVMEMSGKSVTYLPL